MRKIVAGAIIGLVALSGQAFAKQTGAAVAPIATQVGSRVSGQSANANQLMGLGLIPTVILVAAGVTLIAIVADNDDDNKNSCTSSGC